MRTIILAMALLVGLAAHAHATDDVSLKLDYGHATDPEAVSPQPPMLLALNTHAPTQEAPLRLEYQILTQIDRLSETVRQIHQIVMSLPDNGIAGTRPASSRLPELPPLEHYRTAIEETLARVGRLERLIADISRILSALPRAPAQSAPAITPPASTGAAAPHRHNASGTTPSPRWTILVAAILVLATLLWRLLQRNKAAAGYGPPLSSGTETPPPNNLTAQKTTDDELTDPVMGPQPAKSTVRDTSPSHADSHQLSAPSTGDATEAIELAEIMVSMGLTEGAANTLVEQIKLDPKRALPHWLKLLEIYRRSGMREQFDQSARELNTHFNVQAGDWKATGNTASVPSLENYPRLMSQIIADWRKPECIEYLAGLLEDNRGGTRAGFPAPVAEEILLLIALQQP